MGSTYNKTIIGVGMDIGRKIKCVQDEIKRRVRIYPKLVENGKMEKDKADIEIEAMKQVLLTLTQLRWLVG